jgi:hypothetical protein
MEIEKGPKSGLCKTRNNIPRAASKQFVGLCYLFV